MCHWILGKQALAFKGIYTYQIIATIYVKQTTIMLILYEVMTETKFVALLSSLCMFLWKCHDIHWKQDPFIKHLKK